MCLHYPQQHTTRQSLYFTGVLTTSKYCQSCPVQHHDCASAAPPPPVVCHQPQVTLTAAGSSKNSSSVTLKAPAAGVTAGANMIQTIFSDYAPNTLPLTAVSTGHTHHNTTHSLHGPLRHLSCPTLLQATHPLQQQTARFQATMASTTNKTGCVTIIPRSSHRHGTC